MRGVHENWLAQASSTAKIRCMRRSRLLVMTVMWRIDYRIFLGNPRGTMLRSPATWLVVLTIGFLAAVLVTPFGKEINGARRWFGFGPISFQPSELAEAFAGDVRWGRMRRTGRARFGVSFWDFAPLIAVFGHCAARPGDQGRFRDDGADRRGGDDHAGHGRLPVVACGVADSTGCFCGMGGDFSRSQFAPL